MTKDQLYSELNYVDATRECRTKYADIVSNDLQLLKPLMNIIFMVGDKLSTRAAWVFEFVVTKDIDLMAPYLEDFVSNISKLQLDSSVRPMAKVTEMIITNYYSNLNSKIRENLTHRQREQIVEACFDWMIRDEKVAVKVYSMSSLYLLGTEFDWIHDELKTILQQDYNQQTAAFKARARHVLKKLGIVTATYRPKNN
ncbi:adenylosuccinate lyase [Winogradskyella sp.]|uniref:adenylosuccinate lyase n=1 Tax=Winogradskyella sp. TaxID=1883156 RepID=UPI003F6B943C